jgi:hypothetical protein
MLFQEACRSLLSDTANDKTAEAMLNDLKRDSGFCRSRIVRPRSGCLV